MDPFDRSRNMSSTAVESQSAYSFHTNNHYQLDPPHISLPPDSNGEDKSDSNAPFMKGPKRKRLAKACDACHKSKRRCDGTAPCSNCYFASKTCTYTDASGRPVPAPRPFKADTPESPPSSDTRQQPYVSPFPETHFSPSQQHHVQSGYVPTAPSTSQLMSDHSEDDRQNGRKRFRSERGNAIASENVPMDPGPAPNLMPDRPAELLDHNLTRELTNLFFTHCHPSRSIIHKPSFSAALSHNRVPSYLLHAVCAMAAPLSKQPRIRTTPCRLAGRVFAQEALSLMFDGAGRLMVELNLATAQALCLLQIHETVASSDNGSSWSSRYHDLAFQIIEKLGVHSPEHPTLTPVPSPEFIQASIERECVRRIFWLIHFFDVVTSIFTKKPTTFKDVDLRLRLPSDETSFELAVHSTLPEYLYLPAVRTQYASEFGHLLRVISIYAKIERALDVLDDPESHASASNALLEAESASDEWMKSLPEHLRFSEESLQVQLSMFETSSNSGAWCFCSMHVYHASCALALNFARQSATRGPKSEPQWALGKLNMILSTLGNRARHTLVLGAALWALTKYCHRDDQEIRTWSLEYEDFWGMKVHDLAMKEWQPKMTSPPLPHQHQQLQQSQQYTPQQQLLLHLHQQNQEQHHQHRRASDIRHIGAGMMPRPPQHDDAVAYNRRGSPNAPSVFPLGLGRSLGDLRLHNRSYADDRGNGTASGSGSANSSANERERDKEQRRINDADIDPALHSGIQVQRTQGIANMGELPQSLPSLKASGLLDSWASTNPRVDAQKMNITQRRPSPLPSLAFAPSPTQDPDPRSVTSGNGMPVGLPWLANESR